MIYTLIHCKSPDEARTLAALLLDRKAAAFASVLPAEVYSCDAPSPRVHTNEALLIAVTSEKDLGALENIARENSPDARGVRIASLTPHRVNHEYKEWLAKC